MDTLDKHPPLDPKRHSTNKRVKARVDPYFGTVVRKADGPKTIGPSLTVGQRNAELEKERIERENARIWKPELERDAAVSAIKRRGHFTKIEVDILRLRYRGNMT